MSAWFGRRRWVAAVDALRTRLWPLPTAAVVAAVALGALVPRVDRQLHAGDGADVAGYLFGGGADAARSVLSAVAASLITVTSLTFSLTVVTLQLASSQYSPRLLRTFTGDGFVQGTLALFLATFTYALTVLRTVRSESSTGPAFVPALSVTLAYVLATASVLGLVLFLAHLTREIRVETVLSRVYLEARTVAEQTFPPLDEGTPAEPPEPPAYAPAPVVADRSGFVVGIDEEALLEAARSTGALVILDVRTGDFVAEGVPVGRVWAVEPPVDAVAAAIDTGVERTSVQDVTFGLRQITDVAVKALSPGVNDPTTAVHALGFSSALLVAFARRRCGPTVLRDDGVVRVVLPGPDLADLLGLAVDQPLRYGRGDPQVVTRLLTMLRDVAHASGTREQRIAVRACLREVLDAQPDDVPTRARRAGEAVVAQVEAALSAAARAGDAVTADPAAPAQRRTAAPSGGAAAAARSR